jgi:thiol:disulfide interchange protein DsbA
MRALLLSILLGSAGLASAQPVAGDGDGDGVDPGSLSETRRPLEAAGFIEGRHYSRLSPAQPTSSSPTTIEIVEFFMYSCPGCNELEPYLQDWLGTRPDYISFVRLPTAWGDVRELHARAFFAAEALEKGAEMHLPFFQEIHANGNPLDTREKLARFFDSFGVNEAAFAEHFDSFGVHTRLSQTRALEERYRVSETPTFVVNGKYRTTVDMVGGSYEQLIALVGLLAADEREKR